MFSVRHCCHVSSHFVVDRNYKNQLTATGSWRSISVIVDKPPFNNRSILSRLYGVVKAREGDCCKRINKLGAAASVGTCQGPEDSCVVNKAPVSVLFGTRGRRAIGR